MKSIRLIGLALVPLFAASPAFAQDANTTATDTGHTWTRLATNSTTGGDADAAFERWAVVGGVMYLQPSSRPLDGSNLKFDSASAPTVSASFFITPHYAVELWGAADKLKHDVSTSEDGKVGSVRQLPVAISGQYHFGTPDQVFRLFLGVGYYQSNFSDENSTSGQHVNVDNAKGAIGTVGVDMNFTKHWFARFDARYMTGSPDIKINGSSNGRDLDLNPWTVGAGVGFRF